MVYKAYTYKILIVKRLTYYDKDIKIKYTLIAPESIVTFIKIWVLILYQNSSCFTD